MESRDLLPKRRLLAQRPELIQRYIRITIVRRGAALGKSIGRRISRLRMMPRERSQRREIASVVDAYAVEAMRARRLGLHANEAVLNLALYFLVAERDIQVMKVDALTHPDPWTRSLCTRVILLTIHELDLDKASGRRIRDALDATDASQALRREISEGLRKVRSAQQKAKRQFASLRHATIAHRDADAIAQFRNISSIDSLVILQTVAEFYEGTHEFLGAIPKLLGHVAGMRGLAMQLFDRQNQT